MERCTRCSAALPQGYKDGWCRDCRRTQAAIWRAANPERYREIHAQYRARHKNDAPREGRICGAAGCKNVLPPERRDGVCSDCRRSYSKKWAEANPEKRLAIYKRHNAKRKAEPRPETPEARLRRLAKQRERARRQRELPGYRAYAFAWREKNKERRRQKAQERYQANPERYLDYVHKRRARKAASGGSHSSEQWRALLESCGWRCAYCDVALTKGTACRDHRLPLSRGGSNDIENIVPACRRCNLRKHDKTAEEFRAYLAATSANPPRPPKRRRHSRA